MQGKNYVLRAQLLCDTKVVYNFFSTSMKKKKLQKHYLYPVISALLLFIALLIGYYSLVIVPSRAVPSTLKQTQNILSKQQAELLQIRVSIVQLAKLNPSSARYRYAKERIYTNIEESTQKGRALIETPLPEPPQIHPEVFDSISEMYPQMTNEAKEIFDEHDSIVAQQRDFDETFEKVFEFFPRTYLAYTEDTETLATEIERTVEGLTSIAEAAPDYEDEITLLVSSLEELATNIVRPEAYATLLEDFATDYSELKVLIYKEKMETLKSPENIESLARLTSLLNKYRNFGIAIDEELGRN